MPTATTFENFQITNLGPLTATFTAPASCYTGGTGALAYASKALPEAVYWANVCTLPTADACVPSGSAIAQWQSSHWLDVTQTLVPYYSPAVDCPAGWTTAGITARNTDGSPGTASGAFSMNISTATTTTPGLAGRPNFLPQQVALAQVLDPGETAVLCCPSGYTAHSAGPVCYSVLSSQPPLAGATACQLDYFPGELPTAHRNLTVDGRVVSTAFLLPPTSSISVTAVTTTFGASATTALVAEKRFAMLNLVHKPSDASAAPGASSSSGGAVPTPSTNAAAGVRRRLAGVGGVWQAAVIMSAGAAFMLQL